jgi:hypothetical protein
MQESGQTIRRGANREKSANKAGYVAENRAEDALDAPVEALRKAARELKRATDAFSDLRGTKEFERQVRGAFEYQFRHVRKNVAALTKLLEAKEARSSRR